MAMRMVALVRNIASGLHEHPGSSFSCLDNEPVEKHGKDERDMLGQLLT